MTPETLLKTIVTSLVDHPEEVKIDKTNDDMGVLLKLDLHPEDMGKVIGKEGMIAKAVRTILHAYGMKNKARINLKIMEPLRS